MASGSTGVQHLASLHLHIGDTFDDHAGVADDGWPWTRTRRPVMRTLPRRSSPERPAASVDLDHPAYDGLGRQVALADRCVERRHVSRALKLDRSLGERLVRPAPA